MKRSISMLFISGILFALLLAGPLPAGPLAEGQQKQYLSDVAPLVRQVQEAGGKWIDAKILHDQLAEESLKKHVRSQQYVDAMRILGSLQDRMGKLVGKEVLKAGMSLMLEALGSLTQGGAADVGVDLCYKIYNKAMNPPANRPAVNYWNELGVECGEGVSQIRKDQEVLNAETQKLDQNLADADKKADALKKVYDELIARLEQAERDHRQAMDSLLKGEDDYEQAQAAQAKKAIEDAQDAADAARRSESPHFAPFLAPLKAMTDAILDNTLPAGVSFDLDWKRVMDQARQHLERCQEAEPPSNKGAAQALYDDFTGQSAALRKKAENARDARLDKIKKIRDAITGIQTSFVDQLKAEAAAPQTTEALGLLDASVPEYLSDRDRVRRMDASEIQREAKKFNDAADKLEGLRKFIDTRYPAFSAESTTADKTWKQAKEDTEVLWASSHDLLSWGGQGMFTPLGEADVKAKEEKVIEAGHVVRDGLLSPARRDAVSQGIQRFREAAAYLLSQLAAADEYESQAGEYLKINRAKGNGIRQAVVIYNERIKKLTEATYACDVWQSYYEQFQKDPKHASLNKDVRSALSVVTIEDHQKNAAELKDIIARCEAAIRDLQSVLLASTRMAAAERRMKLLHEKAAAAAEEMKPFAKDARDASEFFGSADQFLPSFRAYVDRLPALVKLEKETGDFYGKYLGRVEPMGQELNKAADPTGAIGKIIDKHGTFLGLDAETEKKKDRMDALDLPFRSERIDKARQSINTVMWGFMAVAQRMGEQFFTGPRIERFEVSGRPVEQGASGRPVVLDREDLVNGEAVLKGVISSRGVAPLARVRVSLDGGKSWSGSAQPSGKDGFAGRFTPVAGRPMRIKVMAVDERGNEGQEFPWGEGTEFIYSGVSQTQVIQELLRDLSAEYSEENRFALIKRFSWNFNGRYENMDRALQIDFHVYDSIDLKLIVDKVVLTARGEEAMVDLHWIRSWTKTLTLERETQRGDNRFRLIREDNDWKVYAIQGAPLFGTAVDTSIERPVTGTQNNYAVLPIQTSTLIDHIPPSCASEAFSFSAGTKVDVMTGNPDINYSYGSSALNEIHAEGSAQIYDFGPGTLDQVMTAPEVGYTWMVPVTVGNVYIVQTINGKYAKMRITAVNTVSYGICPSLQQITFQWAYQPNGTRDLR